MRLPNPALVAATVAATLAVAVCFALPTSVPGASRPFVHGADVSFASEVENGGGAYRIAGDAGDLFALLADHGVDTVRLRVWHSPAPGAGHRDDVLRLARRAVDAGSAVFLDLHYSDTWADPGQQTKPAAWANLPVSILADSVRAYTRATLECFAAQGTPPVLVQLGNEITPGVLWDEGRVGGRFDTPGQWAQLAMLFRAAADGVADAFPEGARPEIVLHLDRGGDNAGARAFLDRALAAGMEFVVLGLSYYPGWHGSLEDLESNIDDVATRYGKDILIVETGYPWTLDFQDSMHNLVGLSDQLLAGYPATPEGQSAFLRRVRHIVQEVPDGRGRGVIWWAPEWIASPGFGSAWENVALFDGQGNALPALHELGAP